MFVVFDLETTGLRSMADDVIQFAYILYDSNNNFVRAESLYFYYDGMPWSEEAYAVHQIPIEFLQQHKDAFVGNLLKMYSVLMYANVIGHNAADFDCVFAENWLNRMGLPNLRYRCVQDTMVAFKPLTHRARIKLVKLGELLGIPDSAVQYLTKLYFGDSARAQAHDAAYDVCLTALITLQGIRANFINFGDTASVQAEPVEEISMELSDEPSIGRDPQGILLRLKDSNGIRHAYVNTTSGYNEAPVSNAELGELMNTGRYISQMFVQQPDGTYVLDQDGGQLIYTTPNKLELKMGASICNFFTYFLRDYLITSLQKAFKEEEEAESTT